MHETARCKWTHVVTELSKESTRISRLPNMWMKIGEQYKFQWCLRGAPPLPNSFNFMQFWENLAKSYVGASPPPGELAPPPWGNPGSATEFHNALALLRLVTL